MIGNIFYPHNRLTASHKRFRKHLFETCESRAMLSAVPLYASNPTATKKIFLDFDGHVVTDSYWTAPAFGSGVAGNNNSPINAPAYNAPGNADYAFDSALGEYVALPFSADELGFIKMAWQTIAEDFAPSTSM